MKLQSGRSRKR